MNLPPALLSTGLLGFKNSLYLVWLLWPFSKSAMSVLCTRPVSIRQLKRCSISVKISPCSDTEGSVGPQMGRPKGTQKPWIKRKTILFLFSLISTHNIVQNAPMQVSLCNCSSHLWLLHLIQVSQISCLTLGSVPVSQYCTRCIFLIACHGQQSFFLSQGKAISTHQFSIFVPESLSLTSCFQSPSYQMHKG